MGIWDLQREGERQEILKTGGIVKEVKLKATIPNPGTEARSPALQADSLLSELQGKPTNAGDARDMGSISGLGRSPGEGNDNLCRYSCLENSMNRGARWVTVLGVEKNRTQLSACTCTHS